MLIDIKTIGVLAATTADIGEISSRAATEGETSAQKLSIFYLQGDERSPDLMIGGCKTPRLGPG